MSTSTGTEYRELFRMPDPNKGLTMQGTIPFDFESRTVSSYLGLIERLRLVRNPHHDSGPHLSGARGSERRASGRPAHLQRPFR